MTSTGVPVPEARAAIRTELATNLPSRILDDYFHNRATFFVERSGIPSFDSGRDEDDDRAFIALATDGVECLGGVRAIVRRPLVDPRPLPMEHALGHVRLESLFPELDLARVPHAELSRMVVCSRGEALAPSNDIAYRLLRFLLVDGNPAPDVRVAFITSNDVRLRLYRMIGRTLGVRHMEREVEPPAALQATGRNCVHAYLLPSARGGTGRRDLA